MATLKRNLTFDDISDIEHMGVRLGHGAFAQVKLVQHKESETMLAMKNIDLSKSSNFDSEMKQIMIECRIHKGLNHPNIIE